jgi:hypothetical protein
MYAVIANGSILLIPGRRWLRVYTKGITMAGASSVILSPLCDHKAYTRTKTPQHMAFYLHADSRRRSQRILALTGIIFLLLPTPVIASTPPLQPSLSFEIAPAVTNPDTSLTLSAAWNASVAYNRPPEYLIVEVFSVPGGLKLGDFPIPRVHDACGSDTQCAYRMTIGTDAFPAGEFMLIATDPLSGSASRRLVTIPPHRGGEGSGFLGQFEQEQQFFLFSGVSALVLVYLLAILVRGRAG